MEYCKVFIMDTNFSEPIYLEFDRIKLMRRLNAVIVDNVVQFTFLPKPNYSLRVESVVSHPEVNFKIYYFQYKEDKQWNI